MEVVFSFFGIKFNDLKIAFVVFLMICCYRWNVCIPPKICTLKPNLP